MNNVTKISFLWALLVISYCLHTQFELMGIFFGTDLKAPGATGEMPYWMHFFLIAINIIPLIMVLLTLFMSGKIFRLINFSLSILFGLLNGYHLIATAMSDFKNLSQIILLSFILAANVLLVLTLNKWRRENI
jgi:hypothetical protein